MDRILGFTGLCAGMVFIGYLLGSKVNQRTEQTTTTAREEYTETASTSEQFEDRVTVRRIDPSGAIQEVIKERIAKTQQVAVKSDKREESKTVTLIPHAHVTQYRLGLSVSSLDLRNKPEYAVTIARRAVGDLWLEGRYQFKTKEISVGISYEF